MTRRLYYDDSYLERFRATAVEVEGNKVYLDQTAFYPASGGQPFDLGAIGGVPVAAVMDEEDRVAHVMVGEVSPGAVECVIDWPRRHDHMQQHTGQHLLSAVLMAERGVETVSFHMGAETSTIDVAAAELEPGAVGKVEESVNRRVFENLPVTVSYHEATTDMGLRKASQREGTLRVVSIGDLDRSACGGTHVRSTGEIGPVLIRKLDKIRGNVRIEFVCGMRAVHRARTDYDLLSRVARVFSSTLEDAADLAASQAERLAESEKARRKLWLEGASSRGRQLYVQTVPGSGGVRVHERKVRSASDALRVEAQAFVGEGSAVFLALIDEPPSLLLAASQDSPIVAGAVLKPLLEGCGGRGGGNAQVAQGSVPDIISRDAVAEKLRQLVR